MKHPMTPAAVQALHKKMAEEAASRGLPPTVLKCLNYKNETACRASLDQVDKAFREAVQTGVGERLRGRTPAAARPAEASAASQALEKIRQAMNL